MQNINKYISIFKISFQEEFAYRVNFIMWRVRNVLQIFLVFFLWDSIYSNPGTQLFGYDRNKILTYVFGILILRAIVLSSRTVDVAGEISSGDLTNFLLKPVSYIKYWFTRDISSKVLNISFAIFETGLLFALLKPPFYLQTDPFYLILFLLAIVFAILIFFNLLFLVNLITFWIPTAGWGAQFLFIGIFVEFFSGGVFPIDILPQVLQKIIYTLPFPYLLFFPLQVYLGKLDMGGAIRGVGVAAIWAILLYFVMNFVWNKGLKRFAAEGR